MRSGEKVTFRLSVPAELGCATPYLCIARADDEKPVLLPLQADGRREGRDLFSLVLTAGAAGAYFYYFDLYVNFTKVFCGDRGEGTLSREPQGPRYQLTVYEPEFRTPWNARGGVMYQIFPDRFCDCLLYTSRCV